MKYLMNAFKSVAQQATQSRAATRHGIVTSYDPKTYAVKVQLQPEGVLTGWIPLKSAWVGNGCGGWRFYNAVERPLPCPSGEFWLVHRKGAQLKFRNDGTVELRATQDLNIQANSDVHLDVSGTLQSRASQWNHKGPV